MATVTIEDTTASGQIDVADSSLLGKSQLQALVCGTKDFLRELPGPLNQVKFKSASFTVKFQSPVIPITGAFGLCISTGQSAQLTLYRTGDSPLFATDDFAPAVNIEPNQYWLNFELATSFQFKAEASAGAGGAFGVAIAKGTVATFDVYALFTSKATEPSPSLKDAIEQTLANFRVLKRAADIREQAPGVISVCDVAGTLTLGASWSLPLSVNQLSLADAQIPFKVDVQPAVAVTLSGSLSIDGEYSVRAWKQTESILILGVYKKKGSTFKASFSAAAGIGANAGNTELASTILSAIAPGIDTSVLAKDAAAVAKTLKESIDRSLSISLNASCAASCEDEAAFLYRLDLSRDTEATGRALDAALGGDWTPLASLANATELRNVIGQTLESKHKLIVNLLGIYNYESLNDFARSSTILHSPEDGSITITDRATTSRLSVASTPYAADRDRLRKVLHEATIATGAYAFARASSSAQYKIKQTLVDYQERMDKPTLFKKLSVGPALALVTKEDVAAAVKNGEYRHILIEVEQSLDSDDAMNMFFANPQLRTPRALDELTALGRNVLSEFLNSDNPVDQRRLTALGAGWNAEAPPSDPVLRTDWLDVMWWASAIHSVGPPLAQVIQAFARLPPGKDPSTDADFTKKRKALTKALEEAAEKTHSAFEEGWALAVIFTLARCRTHASLNASWDGKLILKAQREPLSSTAKA